MTNRERALAVLNYEPYDRMPVVHFGYWWETLEKWVAEGHLAAAEIAGYGDGNPVDDALAAKIGFDFNRQSMFYTGTGLRPPFESKVIEEHPDGLRRSAHFGGAANVVSFVWDGDDLLNEYVLGGVSCRYDVLDGEVLGEKRGAARYLYVPDPLGSVNHLLDTSQTIAGTYVYWPYGELQAHTEADTPLQFIGALGYQTWTTNRTYVRARYYRPDLGRWQTRDPIGFAGGDWNLCSYCEHDPLGAVDPAVQNFRVNAVPETALIQLPILLALGGAAWWKRRRHAA